MGKGCLCSLDGNVDPKIRLEIGFIARESASNFELYARLVRLKLGVVLWGSPRFNWLPVCTGGDCSFRPGKSLKKEKLAMRSDLVFGALSHVSNRYQLCQLASKATRKLHKPNTRLQDTANEVLARFHTTNPGAALPVQTSAAQPVERRRAA
jgi:hypothetical protein